MNGSRKTLRILLAVAFAALMTFTLVTPASTQLPSAIYIDFPVTDAIPSRDGKYLYLSSKSEYKLYIVKMADGSIEYITFDNMPESITIAPQGDAIYLALLTREHDYGWSEQEGYIAEIDPNTRSVVREFWINEDPYDLATTSDGYLYVSPGSGQWDQVKGYNLATTIEVGSASIRHRSRIKLHPGENAIYAIDTDLSPCDIKKFLISSGNISLLYDSPYHGDYPMCGDLEISHDGTKIYTKCGHIFGSTEDQETDVVHIGTLGTGWNALAFDDRDNAYTVDDTSVRKWRHTTHAQTWIKSIDGKGKFVFYKDSYLIVITEAGDFSTQSSIQFIDPTVKGDIDGDGHVDLQDSITALQVSSARSPSARLDLSGDVNADKRIGLEEAVYAIQTAARLRNYPTLNPIGNKSVDEGETLAFTILASDPEGQALSFSTDNLPIGAEFDLETKTFSWTPTHSQSGIYQVTFTVTDIDSYSDSETLTITVNDTITLFDAPTYFPLQVGNWWDYIEEGSGGVGRTSVSGTKSIGGWTTHAMQYPGGDKEYYTADSNGLRLFGTYIITPEYTGDIVFNSPLLLMPNNSTVGSPEQVSSSSYPLTVYVPSYGYFTVTIDITTRMRLVAMEDVTTQNRVLKNCFKTSLQIKQVIRETGETIESGTTVYWLYKGVGAVKVTDSDSSITISASYVNGVSDTY